MIRRVFGCLAAAFLMAPVAAAQANPGAGDSVTPRIQQELIAAREVVWRAWFGGDSARLAEVIPPALAAGERDGWTTRSMEIAASRAFVREGNRLVELQFHNTSIVLRGPVAFMSARYTYVVEGRDRKRNTVNGMATEVFVREQGRWTNPFWYLDTRSP